MKEQRTTNDCPQDVLLERLRLGGLAAERDMTVDMRGHTAHVGGSVTSLEHKRLAQRIASQLEGVHHVVNTLRVAPLAVVDDESIREYLMGALTRNAMIDETTLYVEVVHCVAYLRGIARTATERCAAEDEAWATPGVRRVVNSIPVQSVAVRHEAAISEEILQSITDRLGVAASNISVEAREGVVHLKGAVPSERIKATAERLAWTPSLTDVVSELLVVPDQDLVGGPARRIR